MSISTTEPRPKHPPITEQCVEEEVLEWYRMSPQERWAESMRLWNTFFLLGGQLDPESDTQSPFYDSGARRGGPADGRPGMRALRRSGV